jgi:riboflavin kinase/FMN adenylyltransferase
MQVIENITTMEQYPHPVVTVGSFDGVHLGHREIIGEVANRAKRMKGTGVLITFEPHPQSVVAPETAPSLLTTREEKLELLSQTALDIVCIVPFSLELSQKSPHDFVRHLLVGTLGMKEMVIGHNHAFGKDRKGTVSDLVALGQSLGFDVHTVSPVQLKGQRISSSRIRDLISKGKVEEAGQALGHLYFFGGQIVQGTAMGRVLSFPTANIRLSHPQKLCPGDGVYAIWAQFDHHKYAGMMNIGRRPTFGNFDRTIEVHIFHFQGNIYGRTLRIDVANRIREERRFQNEHELITQIQKDKSDSLDLLSHMLSLSEVH